MSSFYRFADLNGDGTGSKQANVNGSVTPQVFKLAPRTGEQYLRVERVIVHIKDTGSLDADGYGNLAALTNGVQVALHNASDDSIINNLTDGLPVKTNGEWGRMCYDAVPLTFGQGDEIFNVRWTFSKAGKPIEVTSQQYIGVTIQDNLTGLNDHTFKFDGVVKT